ncbi:MAG: thioesterase family protein [Bacteroidales bacterium]|jgi:predicted thioesterase|nr:thioesterase family protein [Bacteroidales bacterium]MCI1785744.1 thioesterase family protein [Bacteroidales bacterium]
MLKTGIKGHREITVTYQMTADYIGSGMVKVFATPAMIACMEKTARLSVKQYLEPGQGTVGTKVDVSHVASTPVGMKVSCDTELIEIDRRRLVFKVSAFDEKGLIGEGKHERFIVDEEKFQAKADAKSEN